jgi:putative membrane protein
LTSARPPVHIALGSWIDCDPARSPTHGAGQDNLTNPSRTSSSHSSPIDDPRVYLAAERTFLAWVRTSIALMGFGFLIARFALIIREYSLAGTPGATARPGLPTWLGFGMVCGGAAVCALAAVRHHGYISALERGVANPRLSIRPSLLMAVMLALVGLAIAIHILTL